jgi:hypothetical protein
MRRRERSPLGLPVGTRSSGGGGGGGGAGSREAELVAREGSGAAWGAGGGGLAAQQPRAASAQHWLPAGEACGLLAKSCQECRKGSDMMRACDVHLRLAEDRDACTRCVRMGLVCTVGTGRSAATITEQVKSWSDCGVEVVGRGESTDTLPFPQAFWRCALADCECGYGERQKLYANGGRWSFLQRSSGSTQPAGMGRCAAFHASAEPES